MIYQGSYQDIYCTVFCGRFAFLCDWSPKPEKTHSDASTFGHDLDLAIPHNSPTTRSFPPNRTLAHPICSWKYSKTAEKDYKTNGRGDHADCKKALQQYLGDTLALNFGHVYKATTWPKNSTS
ncbi:hypothetical protein GCK72_026199 [Caenorhabditis remanei]|uniref:Uncharacterized protein n=1 Tax=Caenorhabditis remanei TaxID=31234 RepID=A0A6A5G463_CAERE|nr:hypothetical protein GCK72_026199 [Caenorhabditis remanei]KAF1749730.1 hypothetical protein GCK72_026199 [Caenorhabditis remanei]